MNLYGKAILTLAIAGAATTAASAWPKPYAGQKLHAEIGVLRMFGNGNRAGGLEIRTAGGVSQTFSTTLKTTWNRKRIACWQPPTAQTPCAEWPKNIIVGRTSVRVTYWDAAYSGGPGIPGPERVVKDVSAL